MADRLIPKGKSLFAHISLPHRDVFDSPVKASKDAPPKEKPARTLTIKEAIGGYSLSGPNWNDKTAVCENKAALLKAVDEAFPVDEPSKKDSDKDEKSE